jgi:MerR family transcriptional regulator, redox-sensitive transcriptional activator SoxR
MDELLSIGDVAERTGVTTATLRYYETEGLLRPVRTAGNQRRFEREVLRRVSFIRIAQQIGLTLDEIRAHLASLPHERTPTKADWAKLSRGWRPRLDEQIAMMQRLRDQLEDCIGCGCLSLKSCRLYNPDDTAARFGAGARYLLGDPPTTP